MDKKTRVRNALNQLPVDKIPAGFWFHFLGDQAAGEECIAAHVGYYELSQIDFIKIMCDGYFEYPIPAEIREAADWYKLKPLGKNHPFIQEQVKRARSINERINGECCTFYNVFAPFSSIRFGTSDELVMKHLKEDPEAILYALDVIAQDNALLAELVLTEGMCEGIYYCLQGAETDRFTYEQYREWITPSDMYVLDHANRFSDYNMLHLCGWAGIKNRLECWQDYPAKALNWSISVEGLGLAEGKAFFGGRTVMGGFDNTKEGVLYSGTQTEVERFTEQLVSQTDPAGFLICADCSVPADIDRQRIRWVTDTLQKQSLS
jgi:uroporphyrinogen decarboxylase